MKTYDTSGDYAMTLYKEGSNSNTYVAKSATFSGILSSLRSQSAGNYIIEVRKGYTLLDDDVTAFNNATGLTNKNVTDYNGSRSWLACWWKPELTVLQLSMEQYISAVSVADLEKLKFQR